MFVKRNSLTYWWPVTVSMPSATAAGTYEKQSFVAQFETILPEEGKEIDDEVRSAILKGDTSKQDALLFRIVKGWKEIADEAGTSVPFSTETLREYCAAMPWFRIGLYRAWQESQSGLLPGN